MTTMCLCSCLLPCVYSLLSYQCILVLVLSDMYCGCLPLPGLMICASSVECWGAGNLTKMPGVLCTHGRTGPSWGGRGFWSCIIVCIICIICMTLNNKYRNTEPLIRTNVTDSLSHSFTSIYLMRLKPHDNCVTYLILFLSKYYLFFMVDLGRGSYHYHELDVMKKIKHWR